MSWYRKLMPSRIRPSAERKKVPEGVWGKCVSCDELYYQPELEGNQMVCLHCGHHMRLGARRRLDLFLDPGERRELAAGVETRDLLRFKDQIRYRDRLSRAQRATGERDALVVMAGAVHGRPVVAAAFEFDFIGGSMGAAVGERFCRGVAHCIVHNRPLVCFSTSGGARMQEGLRSLMQMAKVSAALARLSELRLPYVSVLTDPTMGGVSASLAMLGDVIIAEPRALIGFAGPRVIEQTVRQTLPAGFQRSEFLLEHGAIDMIVPRLELRDRIAGLLGLLGGGRANVDRG